MKLLSDAQGESIKMCTSPRFSEYVAELIHKHGVRVIVETGTYTGQGSTDVLAREMAKAMNPGRIITIECNWLSWRRAMRHLARYPFVECVWGLTLDSAEATAFLESDPILQNHVDYPEIYIDDVVAPREFYLREMKGALGGYPKEWRYKIRMIIDRLFLYSGSDLLRRRLMPVRDKAPLILLDSAGGVGYLEFLTMMEVMGDRPFVLVLDDINHLKHFRSYRDLRASSSANIVAADEKEGWLFAEINRRSSL